MKGGKGGQGRTRSKTRVAEETKPRGGVRKGAAKRDWGAIPREDDAPIGESAKTPRSRPAAIPPKTR